MGLTWLGLLSLHEQMEMNGTHDREQESRQGELSAGSQLGGGQIDATKPVALASERVTLMSEERQSRDMHARGGRRDKASGLALGGGGQRLCADAKGNGEPVKDFSKSATWLNPPPEPGSGMTPQDRRAKQNQKLLTPRSFFFFFLLCPAKVAAAFSGDGSSARAWFSEERQTDFTVLSLTCRRVSLGKWKP